MEPALFPGLWPRFLRKVDPGWRALEVCLDIRLLGVGLLAGIVVEAHHAVNGASGFHGRWAAAKVLKTQHSGSLG